MPWSVRRVCLPLLVLLSGWTGELASGDPTARLLAEMRSYMDLRAAPCVDFYRYACGNWERVHAQAIHEQRHYVDQIGALEYRADRRLADTLEERLRAAKTETNDVYRKLRDYYAACRALPAYDVDAQLRQVPWLEAAEGADWSWMQTLGRLRGLGLNGVLLDEQVRHRDSVHFIVELDRPSSVALSATELQAVAELSRSSVVGERGAAERLRYFQARLEAIAAMPHAVDAPHELTLAQLAERMPGLDWHAYFAALLPTWQRAQLPHQPLVLRNIAYMRRLGDLAAKTAPATLLLYFRLKLRSLLAAEAPPDAAPHQCVRHMRLHLGLALDYLDEREYYGYRRNASDAAIRRVFGAVQERFLALVEAHAEQLPPPQVALLRAKIEHMQLNIGNLPRGVGDAYYRDFYRALQAERGGIGGDDDGGAFYRNHLRALQHSVAQRHRLLQLQAPSPEHSYYVWPHASPAFQATANLLLIPLAYLQEPVFDADYHALFLHAELGNTLGHELMHAFDRRGLLHDAHGNPSDPDAAGALHDHAAVARTLRCLKAVPTTDIDEKIADFGGFRLAYESYFETTTATAAARAEPRLELLSDGSSLTPKQLFFVKFAQFFCAVRPERIRYARTHDSPFERVPQVVANHGDFAREFGCAPTPRECHL